MVHRESRPIAFHIDAMGQLENDADYLRQGVWWLPNDKVTDYLILTNQGDKLMPVSLSLYDGSGRAYAKALTLPGRRILRLSVRQLLREGGLSGSYGGIQVHALANARALDTLHVLYDEDAGFSALLKMFDHDPAATIQQRDYGEKAVWTLHAPMLALSHPDPNLLMPTGTVLDPKIFIRNTTGTGVSANISFYWKSALLAGKTTGPALSLGPYQTRQLRLSELSSNQVPPSNAYWSSVAITTSGKPDEVVAIAASYDEHLRYGAQTPFSDQLSSLWEGGEWIADASRNSLITVGNGSLKPTRARFILFYNQGFSKYEIEQALEPNEQMWVDVGDLVRSSRPDIHGIVLPKRLSSGSYQFRDLTNPLNGTLFEGKVVYDLTNGHVTYGCAACCSTRSTYLNYDPFTISLVNSFYNGVTTVDDCGDPPQNSSGAFYNWTTQDNSIAITSNDGLHTGQSIGNTVSSTSGKVIHTNGRNGCYLIPAEPQGSTSVVATPTNFTSPAPTKTLDGNLIYHYSFQSSSGNLGDLSACKVGESVFYPGSSSPYVWPLPMISNTTNPTVILGPATGGGFQDSNFPPTSYNKPYSAASFQAIQRLEWTCTNYQSGAIQNFVSDVTITRSISQAGGVWIYSITKGSDTNTAPLP